MKDDEKADFNKKINAERKFFEAGFDEVFRIDEFSRDLKRFGFKTSQEYGDIFFFGGGEQFLKPQSRRKNDIQQ